MIDLPGIAADMARANPELRPCLPAIEKELLHFEILAAMQRAGHLQGLVFKGGTCLRLCHGALRFSEDLDFSGGKSFVPAGRHLFGQAGGVPDVRGESAEPPASRRVGRAVDSAAPVRAPAPECRGDIADREGQGGLVGPGRRIRAGVRPRGRPDRRHRALSPRLNSDRRDRRDRQAPRRRGGVPCRAQPPMSWK